MNVIKTGKPYSLYNLIPHPIYGNVFFNIRAFKVGEGMGMIISNVTKNKRIEDELIKTKAKLEYLLVSSPAAIYSSELAGDFKLNFVSENIKDIMGYKPEEFLADPKFVDKRIHPEDRKRIVKSLVEVSKNNNFQGIYRFKHKNGKYIWILEEAKIIFDEEGNAIDRVGYFSDISKRMQIEESLKKTEEMYEDLYENSPDMLISIDPKTSNIIRCNQTLVKNLGYKKDNIVGSTVFNLYHPDCLEDAKRAFKIFLENGEIKGVELQLKHMNGRKINVSLNASAIYDKKGNILYSRSALRDITEHKQIEKALRESEERYRLLIEHLGEGIGIVDGEENIVFSNNVLDKIYGVHSGNLIGRNLSEFLTPEDFQKIKEKTKLRRKGEGDKYGLEILRPNGEKRQINVTSTPYFDKEGEFIGTLGVTVDVTERNQMEKALRESNEKYQMLIENMKEGLVFEDPEGYISFVNPRIQEMLGFSEDELLGKHWSEFVCPEILDKAMAETSKRPKGISSTYESCFLAKNKRVIPTMVTGTPIFSAEKELEGVLVVLNDITKHKEAEEREEFLLTLLRHDLGNKMHVVNGYLQLLQTLDISEKGKEWIETALASSHESFQLMQKVELLMKIEREKDLQPINLNSLMKEVLIKSKTKALEKGIEIECKGVSFKVQGGLLLEELFLNLIENSINHADCSKIMISGHEEKEYIVVVVEDDGKGISKSIRKILFTKKAKGRGSTGSGLGTYLIRKIVENYGGKVKFKESELGGARFDITLNKL